MTERQSKHVSLQIDAQAAPKALMRQEEQDTLGSDRADNDPIDATDTLWARLFGTGASIPDLTAVPDETEIGLVGSNASSLANTSEGTSVAASDDSSIADLTLVSAESQIAHQFHQFGSAASPGSNASNAANTSSVPSSAPSSEAMEAMSVAPIVPILRIDSELIKTNGSGNYTGPKIPSFKDCRDVWVPEWSSEDPEENCKKWARNSEWGALSTASSLKGACKVEWAQSNCMATCGCEDVRRAWLDRAILQIVEGMGLSRQQMEEVESTLEGISSSGKEAVLHVVWAAAGALNMDKAKASPAAAGKADASGEAAETGDATDEGSAEESTTISPAAASDIIRMFAALGLDTEQAKQLNATLQLIDPEHYDDVLDVLTAIHKSASTTTTSTAVSDEEIEQAAYGLGIKEEDIAQIHATLSNIKPELNHEILHTVEDLKASTKQIGVERTGKAIVKHLQNLSKPSTNHLPHEVEPNNFVISVASADARELYRETQGHDPQGFYLKVSLPVEKVVSFIEKKAGVSVEPRRLSLAIARLEFSWPSSSCSNDESGFTDFKLLDFHAGQMSNEGSSCGSLVATSIDQNGELRLPSKGSQDLFLLAGMFGSKYSDSYEGAQVNLKISQLVFHEIREGGDVVEYSICGRGSLTWKDQHFYLGCPDENPLTIAHPEGSLGDSVKLCGGGVPAEDDAIQSNCFAVPESSEM